MVTSEYYFPSSDQKTLLHVNQWTPVSAPLRGIVQIAHGVAEYGRRYEPFARFLCAQGFLVTAHDHLGHGLSVADGAPRLFFGETEGWTHVVDDVAALQERVSRAHPGLPYFVFGHSMGSFITRAYLIRYPGRVRGAVLCGTGRQSPAVLAAGRLAADREIRRLGPAAFSPLANRLAFGSYNKSFPAVRTEFDWLSASEENVDAYMADPLCGGEITLGLFRDMLEGIGFIGKSANLARMDKGCAIFLIAGDQDPVGDLGKGVEKVRELYQRAGIGDLRMKLYHGLRHEILNEKQRKFVYQDVLNWLEERL